MTQKEHKIEINKIKSKELYHGKEIGEAVNKGGGLGESLLKSITEIVGRVSGDDEHRGSNTSQMNCKNGATSGFTHPSFPANKYPFQGFLVQYILHCWLQWLSHLRI